MKSASETEQQTKQEMNNLFQHKKNININIKQIFPYKLHEQKEY
jgi:hypothetical protein